MERKCFRCEKAISPCGEWEKDEISAPPSKATAWTTTGNFGSTVFDTFGNGPILELFICDECLVSHADLVYQYRVERSQTIKDVKKFDPHNLEDM